jgi:chromosome segregation ATPase
VAELVLTARRELSEALDRLEQLTAQVLSLAKEVSHMKAHLHGEGRSVKLNREQLNLLSCHLPEMRDRYCKGQSEFQALNDLRERVQEALSW